MGRIKGDSKFGLKQKKEQTRNALSILIQELKASGCSIHDPYYIHYKRKRENPVLKTPEEIDEAHANTTAKGWTRHSKFQQEKKKKIHTVPTPTGNDPLSMI